ncbi:MAG TPA: hypothetical protein VF678_14035 [bacterium]
MLRALQMSASLRMLLLATVAGALAACAVAPKPGPVTFREIQREDDVYRVIAQWQGAAPSDLEDRLLVRCAEVVRQDGGTAFLVVNADFEVTNTTFLQDGSPTTPVFRIPAASSDDASKAQPAAPVSATVTIKLFRPGKAPAGYRLYDVGKILRQHRAVSVHMDGSADGRVGMSQ